MLTDNGLFLSFDGPPRSGRTFSANRLAETLTADGHDVVRVTMPEDVVPIAKTNVAWMLSRLDDYAAMVRRDVVPVLERGGIAILDGGVSSILIRARAVMGGNVPMGLLALFDTRAMRQAPVDIEWIYLDAREGERKSPGFDCTGSWKSAACCHAKHSTFPDSTSCGARRHATYVLRSKHADAASERFSEVVANLRSERMGDEWAAVVASSQDDRDTATLARRMEQWTPEQPMPVYVAVANWPQYTDATRLGMIAAMPRREGVVQEFMRVLHGSGATLPTGDVGASLSAVEDEVRRAAEAKSVVIDATEAASEVV
jgi:hypothetical protein